MEDNGVVFGDRDISSNTQSSFYFFRGVSTILEGNACFFTYEFASCEDSNVLELCFSVVSERGCFNGADFKIIFDSVQNKASKEFAFNIFCDDQEGFLLLISELKERQNFSDVSKFFLNYEYVTILKFNFLFFFISNEVRRNVSSVEFQTINKFNLVMKCFSLLDSDSSINTNLFVKISKHITDLSVSVCWNSCDIGNSCTSSDLSGAVMELAWNLFNCQIDSSFDMSGIQASFDLFESLLIDGSCQNSSCSGTVTSFIISLICNIFNESGPDVDSLVRKLDSFCYCDSVFSDFGWSVALID